jgi:hypothetical protein
VGLRGIRGRGVHLLFDHFVSEIMVIFEECGGPQHQRNAHRTEALAKEIAYVPVPVGNMHAIPEMWRKRGKEATSKLMYSSMDG